MTSIICANYRYSASLVRRIGNIEERVDFELRPGSDVRGGGHREAASPRKGSGNRD